MHNNLLHRSFISDFVQPRQKVAIVESMELISLKNFYSILRISVRRIYVSAETNF